MKRSAGQPTAVSGTNKIPEPPSDARALTGSGREGCSGKGAEGAGEDCFSMDQKVFIAGRGPAEFFPVRTDEGRKLSAFRVQADRPAVITGIEFGDDMFIFSVSLQNVGAALLLMAVQPCKAFRVEVLLPERRDAEDKPC